MSEMVGADVAMKLEAPVWMYRNGQICAEEDTYGCKVFHRLVRTDMCFSGDKGAGNLSVRSRLVGYKYSYFVILTKLTFFAFVPFGS